MRARRISAFIILTSFLPQLVMAKYEEGPELKIGQRPRYNLTDHTRDEQVGEYTAGYFPGAIMIPVHVWGAAKTTGLFKIPRNTPLSTFLSYARGPSDNAVLDEVKIKRVSEKQEKVYTIDVEDVFENPTANDPILMPGDIVYLEPRRPFVSTEVTQVLAVVGTIAGIVLAAVIIDEKSR